MEDKEKMNGGEGMNGGFEELTREREFREKVKEQVFYAGVFVDREELYGRTGTKLDNSVDRPHVTTNFQPDETQLYLDSLGSKVRIIVIGYGNNGRNEGLLVSFKADSSEIQAALDKIKCPHITLSSSEDSHPMYTPEALVNEDGTFAEGFRMFNKDERFEISGEYGLYMKKDGEVVNEMEKLKDYVE